ncbi:hypothetical protein TNCV_3893841 [Trichonephila clavipes]|nr:hypothetical protein TNCV_3893841 [Trichonephila clavipes]
MRQAGAVRLSPILNAPGVHRLSFLFTPISLTLSSSYLQPGLSLSTFPNRDLLSSSLDSGQCSSPSSPEKNLLNTRGGCTTRPSSLLIGRSQNSLSSYLRKTHQYTPGPSSPRHHNSLSNIWTHLSITPPVAITPFSQHRKR